MHQTRLPEMTHCRHANGTTAKLVKEFGDGLFDQDDNSQRARLPIDRTSEANANAATTDELHGNNKQVHTSQATIALPAVISFYCLVHLGCPKEASPQQQGHIAPMGRIYQSAPLTTRSLLLCLQPCSVHEPVTTCESTELKRCCCHVRCLKTCFGVLPISGSSMSHAASGIRCMRLKITCCV